MAFRYAWQRNLQQAARTYAQRRDPEAPVGVGSRRQPTTGRRVIGRPHAQRRPSADRSNLPAGAKPAAAPAAAPGWNPGPPAAPAAPTGTPEPAPVMPFDQGAELAISGLQGNYDTTIAGIALRQRLLDQEFGAHNGQLDFVNPDDPWSRSAVLGRKWREAQRAQTGAQFGRGQGYDGSAELQDAYLQRDATGDYAMLQRSYGDQAAALAGDRAAAETALNSGRSEALYDLARRWAADPTKVAAPTVGGDAPAEAPTDSGRAAKPADAPAVVDPGMHRIVGKGPSRKKAVARAARHKIKKGKR